jgi:hypothetical protein
MFRWPRRQDVHDSRGRHASRNGSRWLLRGQSAGLDCNW